MAAHRRPTENSWRTYRRRGEVHARRRDREWTWAAQGQVLTADAGDWDISDDQGRRWSAKDDVFRATYELVGVDRWRRTGTVRARPAVDGERLDTSEGRYVCSADEWVVSRPGDSWAVPAEHFAQVYTLADDD